jgi:putative sigma-54 modulation protein
MQIDIKVRKFELAPEARDTIRRRTQFALGRWSRELARVTITLADINGPRGGADKRCRIQVTGRGLPEVTIEQTGVDPVITASEVLDRVARATARAFDRRRASGMRAAPSPAAPRLAIV